MNKDFDSIEFEKLYCNHNSNLGVKYTKESSKFRIWAPTADYIKLNIYTKGTDEEEGSSLLNTYDMRKAQRGVYEYVIQGDMHGKYYTYTVCVEGKENETQDIYGKACGANGNRSMVVDLSRTNPEGWENDAHVVYPQENSVIWEVHIGDFSNDPKCGVREEHRGKYLAFTEENTCLEGDNTLPTCMSYLKGLGVTHVHLLPAFDFGSIDETEESDNINWGYDPVNYNIPEGSYSTNPYDGTVRILEFKKMVQALHKAGISVIMDVVYNHTHSVMDSSFEKTVPGYYYRKYADGTLSNGSDCGNDTASDREMFRQYMVESILYWATEYHIDGFRFDLMGLHDVVTMNRIRQTVNKIEKYGPWMLIYGEPWSAADSPLRQGMKLANKDAVNMLSPGIKIFNDDLRDAVKGPYNKLDIPGFVNGKPGLEEELVKYLKGGLAEQFPEPDSPERLINYVSAHDNSTLWDKLVDSVNKDNNYDIIDAKLLKMNALAAAIIMMSKGIPFMQAGEEAGRTKQGEDNSYNLSKKLNMLDWKRIHSFSQLTSYYKDLILIRNKYSCINEMSKESANTIKWLNAHEHNQVVVIENKNLLIIFNASDKEYKMDLDGTYSIIAQSFLVDIDGKEQIDKQVCVSPYSMTLLEKN